MTCILLCFPHFVCVCVCVFASERHPDNTHVHLPCPCLFSRSSPISTPATGVSVLFQFLHRVLSFERSYHSLPFVLPSVYDMNIALYGLRAVTTDPEGGGGEEEGNRRRNLDRNDVDVTEEHTHTHTYTHERTPTHPRTLTPRRHTM